MDAVIKGLHYSESHEWVRVEGEEAYVGITAEGQQAFGNIRHITLPDPGEEIAQGEEFGSVGKRYSVSDLIAPVSGTVTEVNTALLKAPERINGNAYEEWLVKVKMSRPAETDTLMDAAAYRQHCRNNL